MQLDHQSICKKIIHRLIFFWWEHRLIIGNEILVFLGLPIIYKSLYRPRHCLHNFIRKYQCSISNWIECVPILNMLASISYIQYLEEAGDRYVFFWSMHGTNITILIYRQLIFLSDILFNNSTCQLASHQVCVCTRSGYT